ncbi:PREDICTED: LEM domain-containing protein 1 isoform X8 [Cercocebus atys]|uniref:LEM domain-containing protein 1 isoform X8 n=1 Tax=Cercocebus atys TaxID=9531 RepID=UPI0005F3C0ED|nr:PREDICTED: LEM domain-containing protein 1 isoform X8 [Cercocebus atys]
MNGSGREGFYHQKRGQTSITMVDVKCLSDCKLQNQLEKLGFSPGPILQLNIILQGNIILSTEKSKKLKKNPVFEIQERQEEIVEINPEYNDSKMIIKVVSPSSFQSRIYKFGQNAIPKLQGHPCLLTSPSPAWPEASTTKPKAVDTYCLDYKPSKGRRWAAKAPSTRITYGTITKKRGYCAEDQTIESWKEEGFPVGLKLAVLGVSPQPAVSASQAPSQLLSQNLHFNRIPGDSYPN